MNSTVNKARFVTATLFLLVGVVTVWQSWSLPFGTIRAVQAGFFPLVFGALLVILSSAMLIQLLRTRDKETVQDVPAEETRTTEEPIKLDATSAIEASIDEFSSEERVNVRGLILFSLICILFVVITYFAGFVLASMVAVAGVGYLLTMRGWRLVLLTVLVSVSIWLVFDYWLGVSLPSGVWFN